MVVKEVFTQEFLNQLLMFLILVFSLIFVYGIIREFIYLNQKRKRRYELKDIELIKKKEKKILKNLKKEKEFVNKKIRKLKK
jgi:cell division protein FtsB